MTGSVGIRGPSCETFSPRGDVSLCFVDVCCSKYFHFLCLVLLNSTLSCDVFEFVVEGRPCSCSWIFSADSEGLWILGFRSCVFNPTCPGRIKQRNHRDPARTGPVFRIVFFSFISGRNKWESGCWTCCWDSVFLMLHCDLTGQAFHKQPDYLEETWLWTKSLVLLEINLSSF